MKRELAIQKEVQAVCQQLEIDVSVIESKAKFSAKAQIYKANETEPGHSDLCGNVGSTAVFIELKAPGKRKTLRPQQYSFLRRKLNAGCFAVVVDSGEMLFRLYCQWKKNGISPLIEDLESIRPSP